MKKPLVLSTITVNKRNPKYLDKEKYPILAIYYCDGATFGESLYLVDGEWTNHKPVMLDMEDMLYYIRYDDLIENTFD